MSDLFATIKARFPEAYLDKHNHEIIITCPVQGCGKPKHFGINQKKLVVHCWKCGYGGKLSKFLRDFNIEFDGDLTAEPMVEQKEEGELATVAFPQGFKLLPDKSVMGGLAMNYLLNVRKLPLETITAYKLGYCSSGAFAGRIIIPIFEEEKLVYYLGRSFLGGIYRKVKNPAKLEHGQQKKQGEEYLPNGKAQVVFNIDGVSRYGRRCIITEGVFDAMRTGTEAVALLGKEISNVQFNKLLGKRCDEYVVMLDSDAQDTAMRLAERLAAIVPTRVAKVPAPYDPADYPGDIRDILDKAQIYDYDLSLQFILGS